MQEKQLRPFRIPVRTRKLGFAATTCFTRKVEGLWYVGCGTLGNVALLRATRYRYSYLCGVQLLQAARTGSRVIFAGQLAAAPFPKGLTCLAGYAFTSKKANAKVCFLTFIDNLMSSLMDCKQQSFGSRACNACLFIYYSSRLGWSLASD